MEMNERFDRLENMMTQLIHMVADNNKAIRELREEMNEVKEDLNAVKQELNVVKVTVDRIERQNIKLEGVVERTALRQLYTEGEIDLIKAKLRG